MAGIDAIGKNFDRDENPYIKKFFSIMSGDKTEHTTESGNGKSFINCVFDGYIAKTNNAVMGTMGPDSK